MGIGQLKNSSPADIRTELGSLLHLVMINDALFLAEYPEEMPGKLKSAALWMETATDTEISHRGPEIIELLNLHKRSILQRLPFKSSWRKTCADFFHKLRSDEFTSARGLPLAWVATHFDLAKLPGMLPDMPLHARIGFGPTKGRASVEESMLLDDAFLFLEKARAVHEELLQETEILKKTKPKAMPQSTEHLSLNVCSYARISVFAFFAYAECFVNSVGEDYVLRNPGISPDHTALLRGRSKKGSFISLESKIQKFPQVINPDLKNPITLSDPKQVKEPFLSFLKWVKETRDSIAHHAEGKAPIWLSPQEWVDAADRAARTTLDVSKAFWKACYPERTYPAYLEELDFGSHQKLATTRLHGDLRTVTTTMATHHHE